MVAGVLFNTLFAWLLFAIAFGIGFDVTKDQFPFVEKPSEVQVLSVAEDSPALQAGIVQGDEILSLTKDGQKEILVDAQQAIKNIQQTETPFILEIARDGQMLEIQIDSKKDLEGKKVVGVFLEDIINVQSGFFESIWNGFLLTGFSLVEITFALFDLIADAFVGQAELENVAGPVGIVSLVDEAAQIGVVSLITFTAFISINLAILNLLPFPALDGGRLVVVFIEALTKKTLNYKVVNVVNLVGFLILIGLMVVITISDVGKLL